MFTVTVKYPDDSIETTSFETYEAAANHEAYADAAGFAALLSGFGELDDGELEYLCETDGFGEELGDWEPSTIDEGHNCRVLAERVPFLPADEYADIPF